jgi:peptidoglycan/xylan/chitin deacetylase (PgdA/CDA1 family)
MDQTTPGEESGEPTMKSPSDMTRRGALAATAGALLSCGAGVPPSKARIAISLDLEMSRHYPTRDQTHWDYEKGNLDEPPKQYSIEAAKRGQARGGVLHFFLVGQVLEQENVDWLKRLHADGHPIGNHTYDHINVLANHPGDLQFRFRRAPWLLEGRTTLHAIEWNIRLCAAAMRQRLGFEPNGFRTPGGFTNGLRDRPEVQKILQDLGYGWISSLYPQHLTTKPGIAPDESVFTGILASHSQAQPFRYPSGLLEIPMSGISDVGAFRSAHWSLGSFLEATRRSVTWAIEKGRVFDLLAHPSCLVVEDPNFEIVELICDLVAKSNGRAELIGLDAIARGESS